MKSNRLARASHQRSKVQYSTACVPAGAGELEVYDVKTFPVQDFKRVETFEWISGRGCLRFYIENWIKRIFAGGLPKVLACYSGSRTVSIGFSITVTAAASWDFVIGIFCAGTGVFRPVANLRQFLFFPGENGSVRRCRPVYVT